MCVYRDKEQDLKVEQLMTTVIAVQSRMTVDGIACLLMRRGINGTPVVDDDPVTDPVSKGGLFFMERLFALASASHVVQAIVNLPELIAADNQAGHIHAADVMLRDPVGREVDAKLGAVA